MALKKTANGGVNGIPFTSLDDTGNLFAQLKELVQYIEKEMQEKQEELEVQAEELEVQNEELLESNDALRKAEEISSRLALIVESSGDAIIGKTLDGVITSWNAGAERMFGYSAGEVIGRNISILAPPARPDDVPGILRRIKNGARVEHFETVRVRKDGTPIDISLSVSPIIDRSGRILGASSIKREITEQKLAEKALQEKQEEIEVQAEELAAQNEELRNYNEELEDQIQRRKLAENALKKSQFILAKSQEMAHMGNWAWNVQTGEMVGSDESYRIYGYSPREVASSQDWVMAAAHPDDRAVMAEFIDSIKHEGKRKSIDYRIVRPDGTRRYVMILADKIVRDGTGNVKWVYGIAQDITERKVVEEELKDAKDQSELYLDLMGHDISNMHQIAMAQLELAEEIIDEPEGLKRNSKELIDTPLKTLERSARLIENVRMLQKIRSGEYKMDKIDLSGLLADVVEEHSNIPDKEVTIHYIPVRDHYVKANPLLKDVFTNLVGNAIKHSNGYAATIGIEVNRINDNGSSFYRVAVEDNGPGIPDAKKDDVFHRFKRGQTTARGTGLGLYIVKTLMESFKGRVQVEDRVRGDHTKGSKFLVYLPVADKNV